MGACWSVASVDALAQLKARLKARPRPSPSEREAALALQRCWRDFASGKNTEWREKDAAAKPALTPLVFWMECMSGETTAALKADGMAEFAENLQRTIQADASAFTRFLQLLMYTVLYTFGEHDLERDPTAARSAPVYLPAPASSAAAGRAGGASVHPEPSRSAQPSMAATSTTVPSAKVAAAPPTREDSVPAPLAPVAAAAAAAGPAAAGSGGRATRIKDPFTLDNFSVIAEKHNRYNVTARHFDLTLIATLQTFRRCFGAAYEESAFTPIISESYRIMADIILEAQVLHKAGKLQSPHAGATTQIAMPHSEDRLPGANVAENTQQHTP